MTDEFADYLEQSLRNPAFRAAYDDARARSLLLDNLIALRTSQGITQTQAARRMRTRRSLVTGLENGGTDPHLSTLQRYARALGARLTITIQPAQESQ